ncbi:MAG: M6 family metalloprotease domain-containing protein [Gemmatimonadales bacterium]
MPRPSVSLLLWVLLSLHTGAAAAQYPRSVPGRFEVEGMDFRVDGAWRKRTREIRTVRSQLLRAGAFSALNAASPLGGARVTGLYHVPVVPIAFKNFPPPFPVTAYQDVLFSPAPVTRPYSIKTFYEQLSNGNVTIDGVVLPWVTADTTDTYYEDSCNGVGVLSACAHPGRFGELLLEALRKNDTGTLDWGEFDNDGPDGVANSPDDDGFVDFVTFLQPEVDGACRTPHIWAHRFVISAWNRGSPYVTRSPRRDGSGLPIPGQFIQVQDYTMQSGQGGTNACTAGQLMPIGTEAHETGHAFGLPDLYDTDLRNPAVTQGIGEWGLMGSGNYARPYSPSRYEAWSLAEMGWVTVDTLRTSRRVTLNPVTSSDTVLYIGVPGTDEYFLLENRQALESDSAQMNTGDPNWLRVKAPGLLIWHIDQGQVDAHGFRTGDNRVNTGPIQGVALMQADGLNQLRAPGGSNRGDQGDSYPGSTTNRRFSSSTNPSAGDNQGAFAGFAIDSITQVAPNGAMVFRFLRQARSLFASAQSGGLVRLNGVAYGRFDDIIAPGDQIELDTDSLQSGNGGRSNLRFLSWSNGHPRTQTLVAGIVPDTVIATFAADHRALVTASGGGTVSASLPGNFASGVFLPEGTALTLTPGAPAGLSFVGWTGDTVTAAKPLTLTLKRPYDLTANFATAVVVSAVDAVQEILGTPALTPNQRAFLDQIGNQNGGFDVGDFLAYLQLTGIVPSAQVMQRVLAGPGRRR